MMASIIVLLKLFLGRCHSLSGNRIEMATQITNTKSYEFEWLSSVDPDVALPNFVEWSSKKQFDSGLWNAEQLGKKDTR